jgi:cupin fold WbuC family metalloprotein
MIKKINYEKSNREVGYLYNKIINIKKKDIKGLILNSNYNPNKKSRFCLHKSKNSKIHEMIIYHKKNYYIKPHKHLGKHESFHLIKGSADVIFFQDNGKIDKIIKMGEYTSSKTYYYRINKAIYHSIVIKSPYIIFHEVVLGPFKKSKTKFPKWAPKNLKDFKNFIKKNKRYAKKKKIQN